MGRQLRIGELARRTEVMVKALRLYNQLVLLVAAGRSEANYRVFSEETIACVQSIRALQEAGFTLRDMEQVAAAYGRGEDAEALLPDKLRQVSQRLDEQIDRLEAKRARLRRLLADPATLRCRLAS